MTDTFNTSSPEFEAMKLRIAKALYLAPQTPPDMTLRDRFAMHALQGLLADPNIRASSDEFATKAYGLADAMLRARGVQ